MLELELGSEFAGHRIEGLVGRGGMALVYLATELELNRPVALKLITPQLALDADFRSRFKSEWHLAASIDHPHVVPIYHAGECDGQLYITMRFVDGRDLRDLIAGGAVASDRAVRIVGQVAEALDAAHVRGLVHRDVKPANILLTGAAGREHAYLTDFGLTKNLQTSVRGPTVTGQFLGTVDYAAPEQIEGRRPDARADVYALGCVLFHAVTGHCPYERDSDVAKLFAHLHDPPPAVTALLPQAPAHLDDVIRKALAKAPDDRYASAGELADAAREALNGVSAPTVVAPSTRPVVASPTPPTPAAPRVTSRRLRARRRLILTSAAASALLAAGLAVVLLLGGRDKATDASRYTPPPSAAAVAAPSAPSRWRELKPARTARQQAPAAVADGAIWLVGGLAREQPTVSVEGYDPVINSWKSGPDLPVPLHHAMAASFHGELMVLGGWIPAGDDVSAETTNRVLALRGGKWVALPAMRRRRAAGAAAVVGDKLVVVGGQADGDLVPETEVFDGRRWRGGAPMPTPRDHLAVASDGRYLYAVGGRQLGPDRNLAAFERYDARADRWSKLSPLPTARGGLGAAIVGRRLVTVGGEGATNVFGTVESFDLVTGRWSRLPDLPTPRHGVGVAAIGSRLYVLGGAREPGHLNSSTVSESLAFTPRG